ncbi:MAG: hypothetical protein U0230_22370 [Polyangiales bacterium]
MARRIPFFLASAAALASATGCGSYTTAYRPPVDGRARVVWDQKGEAVVDSGGLPISPACAATLRQMTGQAAIPFAAGNFALPAMPPQYTPAPQVRTQTWAPVYFGPPIVVVRPGYAPTFAQRPRYVSGGGSIGGSPTTIGHGSSGGGGGGGGGGGSGGRGGSGGGGGGDSATAAVIAAVVVAVTLPFIDMGIAMAQPGSDTQAAAAHDIVNAWNDLVRTPGSPCAVGFAPGYGGGMDSTYLPPQKPSESVEVMP